MMRAHLGALTETEYRRVALSRVHPAPYREESL
jgi:hypothetical protein